jgi:hypothetical protein
VSNVPANDPSDPTQSGQFIFGFPVWVCATDGDVTKGLVGGQIEGGGQCAMVFTDDNWASRFLAQVGAQAVPVSVPTAKAFAGVLRDAQRAGISFVVFDDAGQGGDMRVTFEIGELIRLVEKASGS